jgi:hypothetical protein
MQNRAADPMPASGLRCDRHNAVNLGSGRADSKQGRRASDPIRADQQSRCRTEMPFGRQEIPLSADFAGNERAQTGKQGWSACRRTIGPEFAVMEVNFTHSS